MLMAHDCIGALPPWVCLGGAVCGLPHDQGSRGKLVIHHMVAMAEIGSSLLTQVISLFLESQEDDLGHEVQSPVELGRGETLVGQGPQVVGQLIVLLSEEE